MKRNLGLALIAVFVIGLTFLLPTSLAKRDDNSVKHSNSGGQLLPDLFRTSKPNQNPAAPIAMRAVKFAESIPVRDFPAPEMKMGPGKIRELERFEKDEVADGKYGVEEKNDKNREVMRRLDLNAPRTPDQHARCVLARQESCA